MGCCNIQKSDFGLRYHDNSVFANSQWKFIPPLLFLLYRVLLALYFVGWCCYTMTASILSSGGQYFLYLTNWGFITVTLYLLTASFSTCYFHIRTRFNSDLERLSEYDQHSTPWYFRLSWLLYNLAVVVAPVITLVYWVALYEGHGLQLVDFHIHAVNFIAMALEAIIAAMPVRYVHVIYPVILGVCYTVHSLIYWGITGNAIYSILDYTEDPALAAGTSFGCLALIIFFQLLLWGVFHAKQKLSPFSLASTNKIHEAVVSKDTPQCDGVDNVTFTLEKSTQVDLEDEHDANYNQII